MRGENLKKDFPIQNHYKSFSFLPGTGQDFEKPCFWKGFQPEKGRQLKDLI